MSNYVTRPTTKMDRRVLDLLLQEDDECPPTLRCVEAAEKLAEEMQENER